MSEMTDKQQMHMIRLAIQQLYPTAKPTTEVVFVAGTSATLPSGNPIHLEERMLVWNNVEVRCRTARSQDTIYFRQVDGRVFFPVREGQHDLESQIVKFLLDTPAATASEVAHHVKQPELHVKQVLASMVDRGVIILKRTNFGAELYNPKK